VTVCFSGWEQIRLQWKSSSSGWEQHTKHLLSETILSDGFDWLTDWWLRTLSFVHQDGFDFLHGILGLGSCASILDRSSSIWFQIPILTISSLCLIRALNKSMENRTRSSDVMTKPALLLLLMWEERDCDRRSLPWSISNIASQTIGCLFYPRFYFYSRGFLTGKCGKFACATAFCHATRRARQIGKVALIWTKCRGLRGSFRCEFCFVDRSIELSVLSVLYLDNARTNSLSMRRIKSQYT